MLTGPIGRPGSTVEINESGSLERESTKEKVSQCAYEAEQCSRLNKRVHNASRHAS